METKWTTVEYKAHVEQNTPKSKTVQNCVKAFWVGGLICSLGQFLLNVLLSFGIERNMSGSLVSMILIFTGALLTGLNVYDNIGSYAGAGSIVPITGFANSIVAPAMEFKSEGYILGVGARMFVIAGPVLVYGIITSVIGGIFYYLFSIRGSI